MTAKSPSRPPIPTVSDVGTTLYTLTGQRPMWALAGGITATILVLAVVFWNTFATQQAVVRHMGDDMQLQRLRGSILHYDEILTMSAWMATATDDERWARRYQEFVPRLDAAINSAMALHTDADAHAYESTEATEQANAALVAMETEVFKLIRQGQREAAAQILASDAYEANKRHYTSAMSDFDRSLQQHLQQSSDNSRQRVARLGVLMLVASLILSSAWGVVIIIVRSHLKKRFLLESELESAHHDLELRIEHRTQELSETNRSLEHEIIERKRIEESLRQFEQIVACSADMLALLDNRYVHLTANEAYFRAFESNRDDLVGRSMPEVIGDHFFETTIKPHIDACLAGEMVTFQDWFDLPGVGRKYMEVTCAPLQGSRMQIEGFAIAARDITVRKRGMQAQTRLTTAIEAVSEAVVVADTGGVVRYINPACEVLTGYSSEETLESSNNIFKLTQHDRQSQAAFRSTIMRGLSWSGTFRNKRKDGTHYFEHATISPVLNASGGIANYVAVRRDVTNERNLEQQLLQAQKLESIGQLAAGIAHEINTPIQYVGDNTRFVRDGVQDLLTLVERYQEQLDKDAPIQSWSERAAEIRQTMEDLDLEFLVEEVPKALEQTLVGVDRVAELVRAMKNFSHPGGERMTPIDLNTAIDSTITVCRNRWKQVAEMETDYDESLPAVPCLVGEFNQVVLNVVVNAADAIGDVVGSDGEKGLISVSTRQVDEFVEIRISDTGGGIPEEIREKVFEPFFTTKEVGQGTGQGLAISRDVIVSKHSGTFELETDPGKGTTFIIRIPMVAAAQVTQKEAA